MTPRPSGSLRFFSLFGIEVFIHWTWFLVAYLFYSTGGVFGSGLWFVVIYGSLFGIVLLHEFGHALACRSTGGQANLIVLWPLGGVAYVSPPDRPGAVLWSIAAGPLVNVALVPVFAVAILLARWLVPAGAPLHEALWTIGGINLMLLIFNMLPIYPLDGGQIFQALLWFRMGRARSLKFVSTLGLVVAVVVAALLVINGAIFSWGTWLFIIALFVALQAWQGRRMALAMIAMEEYSLGRALQRARQMGDAGSYDRL